MDWGSCRVNLSMNSSWTVLLKWFVHLDMFSDQRIWFRPLSSALFSAILSMHHKNSALFFALQPSVQPHSLSWAHLPTPLYKSLHPTPNSMHGFFKVTSFIIGCLLDMHTCDALGGLMVVLVENNTIWASWDARFSIVYWHFSLITSGLWSHLVVPSLYKYIIYFTQIISFYSCSKWNSYPEI